MKSNSIPQFSLDRFPEAMNLLLTRIDHLEEIICQKEPQLSVDRPITTKELCAHLGVTEPTIIRWKKKGKIPYFRIGSAIRFNLKEVLKSLQK